MEKIMIAILLTVFGLLIAGFAFRLDRKMSQIQIKQNEYDNDRSPLNYSFSIYQPNPEKLPNYEEFTLSPELVIKLKRNQGGKLKRIFLADFELGRLRINTVSEIEKNNLDFDTFYFKKDSTPDEVKIGYMIPPSMGIALNRQALPKFVVIHGFDNHYQVITYLKLIGSPLDNTEDATINFTDLEIYSLGTWKERVNAHGFSKATIERLLDSYEKTRVQYNEVCQFINNNIPN
ncbi:hypothetical protein [Lactococcus lactis]|uniref:hypothetical protein n=1 Tax=Lactococcus lactis TaxID=1358 RepID=UPI0015C2DCA4|nr:hypothetical protein [Lactococcus lactis]MCT0076694.1 hypothetical protein [Lactococcus lactis subsp. lactis]QLF89399.1 hypothetical protein HPC60_01130 [Lactococcus lactis subsp. lactis]